LGEDAVRITVKKSFVIAAALLAACAQSVSAPGGESPKGGAADAGQAASPNIYAPSGPYRLDTNHANLTFAVNHLGLSNYVVRVMKFDATMNLDAINPSQSTITFKADPATLVTGYRGDYRATHKGASFRSWDEALARDAKFLNAGRFSEAAFQSTSVEVTGPGKALVTGDLTLLGQTLPATFDVTWIGSTAKHPMTQAGAFGLSAVGVIRRSAFGMTHLLGTEGRPDIVGDDVTISFSGEFLAGAPAR